MRGFGGVLLSTVLSATYRARTVSTATPPNVLVLLIDDMGYSDLAAFGSTNHSTPNIDGLIRRGVKFTQVRMT